MSKAIEWTGIEEVDAKLRTLDKKVAKRIARSSINAGLAILSRAIKKEAPVGPTKNLKKAIGKRFRKMRKEDVMEAKAGINVGKKAAKQAPHGHLVTLGAKHRHTKEGGSYRGKMPGNDFVERAANQAMPSVRPAMIRKAEQALEKELAKLS